MNSLMGTDICKKKVYYVRVLITLPLAFGTYFGGHLKFEICICTCILIYICFCTFISFCIISQSDLSGKVPNISAKLYTKLHQSLHSLPLFWRPPFWSFYRIANNLLSGILLSFVLSPHLLPWFSMCSSWNHSLDRWRSLCRRPYIISDSFRRKLLKDKSRSISRTLSSVFGLPVPFCTQFLLMIFVHINLDKHVMALVQHNNPGDDKMTLQTNLKDLYKYMPIQTSMQHLKRLWIWW